MSNTKDKLCSESLFLCSDKIIEPSFAKFGTNYNQTSPNYILRLKKTANCICFSHINKHLCFRNKRTMSRELKHSNLTHNNSAL